MLRYTMLQQHAARALTSYELFKLQDMRIVPAARGAVVVLSCVTKQPQVV